MWIWESTRLSFSLLPKNKFISVAKAWNQNSPNQLLHLPILDIAYDQFQDLSLRMTDRQQTEDKDSWTYSWGQNFLSSRAYKTLVGHHQVHVSLNWTWDCFCQSKHKVFFWLYSSRTGSVQGIFLDEETCTCLPTIVLYVILILKKHHNTSFSSDDLQISAGNASIYTCPLIQTSLTLLM
jgi:hypothetical protein